MSFARVMGHDVPLKLVPCNDTVVMLPLCLAATDPEGVISFRFTAHDAAGNVVLANETVWLDANVWNGSAPVLCASARARACARCPFPTSDAAGAQCIPRSWCRPRPTSESTSPASVLS